MEGNSSIARSAYAEHLFGEGTNFKAYEYLGAHRVSGQTFVFRVWAPNADRVFVCGDFNSWRDDLPMEKNESGIWVRVLENLDFGECSRYKFIVDGGGKRVYKCDPYARFSEIPAGGASLFSEPEYVWHDNLHMEYIKGHAEYFLRDKMPPVPMNVYEVHLGSWKRGYGGAFLNYREIADDLSEYAVAMGYTHVELLPVAEHPFDGSWGYQVCGYYAPTSRFGKPEDLKYFIDTMHTHGVGVILDWVPAHFPKDEHGLCEFDGGPLYEYQGVDRMEVPGWGTRRFDVARTQVQSFLISNALYWLDEFHADGLRVDAVASMLYLDYGKKPGEWNPNPDGSNISYESVAFFKKLNRAVKDYFPDRMMIAEESTAFPEITRQSGLGFTMKWNMGWMNDTLSYISTDPVFRSSIHNKLNFAITYAYSENYMLPISHDEVVHGKKSLIDKCPGRYNAKFATVRSYLTFMMTHPGKKLLFMGCEFGQFREWNFADSLEWFLLDYEKHAMLRDFVADLNRLYKHTPSLYEQDCEPGGFEWIFPDNRDDNIIVYERISLKGHRTVVAINFSGLDREEYRIPLREGGYYYEILNSDEICYGGFGYVNEKRLRTRRTPGGGNELVVRLPAFGAAIFDKKHKTGERQ
ncbi:MAG: 1,4-alpha-glucan branching protein GlgB [Clostridia bacterium]|nr:1,4-alpha-glucan branching protein GlgB [Clostridia bacterium]